MNGVGLFALLLAFASYLPIGLVWVALGYFAFSDTFRFDVPPLLALWAVVGLVLSGFALLVATLAHQWTVRPFCLAGIYLALPPIVMAIISLMR